MWTGDDIIFPIPTIISFEMNESAKSSGCLEKSETEWELP